MVVELVKARAEARGCVRAQIIPVENIQGRKAVESGDTCLRKTAAGVDLNRNWAHAWRQARPRAALPFPPDAALCRRCLGAQCAPGGARCYTIGLHDQQRLSLCSASRGRWGARPWARPRPCARPRAELWCAEARRTRCGRVSC